MVDINDAMKVTDFDSLFDIGQFAHAAAVEYITKRMKKMSASEIGFPDHRAGRELYVSGEGIAVRKEGLRDLRYYGGFEYVTDFETIGEITIFYASDDRVDSLLQGIMSRGIELE
jgi:hypothetical protein